MTRLVTCGWETGDLAESGTNTINASATLTVVNTSPVPRAGAYCLKALSTASTQGLAYKTISLGATKTEVWIRWAIYAHTGTSECVLAKLTDSAATDVACVTLAPDNLPRLRQGGTSGGTLLGTSGTQLTPDTWHALDWRHQMTSLTAGTSELWLDGNRVINFTGDNSLTGAVLNVLSLSLGIVNPANAGSNWQHSIDDLAINDTNGTSNFGRIGDGRVVLLVPTGAGSSTVLTRGGTDTGANYSQVNELPPSMGQYVYSATVAQRDLYAMSDVSVAVSSINVVEAIALAQNSDAGGGSIGLTIKSGATTNEATAISLGTSAGYVTSRWETDPNTTAAWTISSVNALEAGATVR